MSLALLAPDEPSASNGYDEALDAVRAALETLGYGQITLTVHDGRVVQLEVTARTRFAKG